mgnify:CR=1 FL=1
MDLRGGGAGGGFADVACGGGAPVGLETLEGGTAAGSAPAASGLVAMTVLGGGGGGGREMAEAGGDGGGRGVALLSLGRLDAVTCMDTD